MLFNTFHFAYFFAILLPVYWILPHSLDSEGLRRRLSPWVLRPLYWVVRQPQNILLLVASYYFYACWNPRFLSLLILSTVMDFGCGLAVDRIDEPRKRKLFVALSMALNLGMLGYFKYYNFFAESLQAMLARAGLYGAAGAPERGPADRDLVLHVPVDELCHRRLSPRHQADAELHRVRRRSSRSSRTWWPGRSCGRRPCCRRSRCPAGSTSSSSTRGPT